MAIKPPSKAAGRKLAYKVHELLDQADTALWDVIQAYDLDPVSGEGDAENSPFDLDLAAARSALDEARKRVGNVVEQFLLTKNRRYFRGRKTTQTRAKANG